MTFADWVNGEVTGFVDFAIIPFLYAIAAFIFLWGIVRLFFTLDEEKRKEGRAFALWGLVGLVLLFSVWSVVQILLSVLQG